MDDLRLAWRLQLALEQEAEMRETYTAAGEDLPERDAALIALRHITAYRKALEGWISRRALRARLVS